MVRIIIHHLLSSILFISYRQQIVSVIYQNTNMSDRNKIEIEYLLKTSPKILYTMISTPSGLSDWFADNVNVRDEVYTFFWDGSEENAKVLSKVKDQSIRFQ